MSDCMECANRKIIEFRSGNLVNRQNMCPHKDCKHHHDFICVHKDYFTQRRSEVSKHLECTSIE